MCASFAYHLRLFNLDFIHTESASTRNDVTRWLPVLLLLLLFECWLRPLGVPSFFFFFYYYFFVSSILFLVTLAGTRILVFYRWFLFFVVASVVIVVVVVEWAEYTRSTRHTCMRASCRVNETRYWIFFFSWYLYEHNSLVAKCRDEHIFGFYTRNSQKSKPKRTKELKMVMCALRRWVCAFAKTKHGEKERKETLRLRYIQLYICVRMQFNLRIRMFGAFFANVFVRC